MQSFFLPTNDHGYTLIELLIVMTISLIVLGGALAAFISFADRRSVSSTVGELKTHLAGAQSDARSGNLGGCDSLAGYRVQTYLTGSDTELSSQAVCIAGVASVAKVFTLSNGVTVSPNLDVTYAVLSAGIDLGGAASQDITVNNGSNTYVFTIFREGRISEGVWQ